MASRSLIKKKQLGKLKITQAVFGKHSLFHSLFHIIHEFLHEFELELFFKEGVRATSYVSGARNKLILIENKKDLES